MGQDGTSKAQPRFIHQRWQQFSFGQSRHMNRLIQTDKFFNKRIYELTDNGLKGQLRRLFNSSEYFVDYEDIGVRILNSKSGNTVWLIIAIIGLVLPILLLTLRLFGGDVEGGAELLYLTIGLVSGLIYWLTYSKSFYLVQQGNKNAIEFIYNNPTKDELGKFIETLKEKRKTVLNDKYGQINVLLPYEQNHQNILWLFNNDVIPKDEFDNRLNELNSKFNRPVETKIGFKTGGEN